jgi:hypothetical protein
MYPWDKYPHRASLSMTNKQVNAYWSTTQTPLRRFEDGTYFLLMGEVFL